MPNSDLLSIGAGFIDAGNDFHNQQQNVGMYRLQRNDNLAFWRMQNEYNSPSAQMQRLKDAGLNPNLVYGRGVGAVGEASPPKPPDRMDSVGPRFRPNISEIYDLQMKQAQADNLRKQNTVLDEELLLKRAQTADTLASASRRTFDLDLELALKETSMDFRRELLRQKSAEIDVLLRRDEREAALNSSNLLEAGQRIVNMRGQSMTTALENKLRTLDLELYEKYKIRPGDPYWLRILAETITGYFSSGKLTPSLFGWGKEKAKKGNSW